MGPVLASSDQSPPRAAPPGGIGRGRDIGAGEVGDLVDEGAPVPAFGDVAAVEQEFGAGRERLPPRLEFGGARVERVRVDHGVVERQPPLAAVREHIDRGKVGSSGEIGVDRLQPVRARGQRHDIELHPARRPRRLHCRDQQLKVRQRGIDIGHGLWHRRGDGRRHGHFITAGGRDGRPQRNLERADMGRRGAVARGRGIRRQRHAGFVGEQRGMGGRVGAMGRRIGQKQTRQRVRREQDAGLERLERQIRQRNASEDSATSHNTTHRQPLTPARPVKNGRVTRIFAGRLVSAPNGTSLHATEACT